MLFEPITKLCFQNLESKSWSSHYNVLSESTCRELIDYVDYHLEEDNFDIAQIGNKLNHKKRTSIRSSKIAWINHWEKHPELLKLNESIISFQSDIAAYFYLSLKRFESQFAYYEQGDFYKKHLDQLAETKHRQVTMILYLNNCPVGGELVIYNKEDRNKIDTIIRPKAGQMVCFFSSQIFHEVLPTSMQRYSLTTWMRDDLIDVII